MIAKIVSDNIIEVYDLSQFDMHAIMHSGQVFRYFEIPSGYLLVAGCNVAKINALKDKVVICSNSSEYFYNYFDLKTDYSEIKLELSKFERLKPIIEVGSGIRILRAEFVEMVISFIISANNNIRRFTKTLNLLAERYGDKLRDGIHAFPNLSQLDLISESEFKEIGCGYRSSYLKNAIEQLKNIDVYELSLLETPQLLKKLCLIDGVGPKVAACIALFTGGLHRQLVPIDTHIKKALIQFGDDAEKIINHEYAGIAQQYIYYWLQYLHKEL